MKAQKSKFNGMWIVSFGGKNYAAETITGALKKALNSDQPLNQTQNKALALPPAKNL